MSPTGRVFDISRGCVDDGPGLRTVIFLKGCHLDCPWCHNLEGKSFEPELAFDASRCINCGQCQEVCLRDWLRSEPEAWREGCVVCGRCAERCPSQARRLVGREFDVEELVAEALVDEDFFAGTGGGVTFSGGEPLAQAEFLFACATRLREHGTHVAVETSGFWPARLVAEVVKHFDLVLFDLKHVDSVKGKEALGRECRAALANLERILGTSVPVEVRLTLVPGFNDTESELAAIARWLSERDRLPPVRLQPFHRLAVAKQELFGRAYLYAGYPSLSGERLKHATEVFGGFRVVLA